MEVDWSMGQILDTLAELGIANVNARSIGHR